MPAQNTPTCPAVVPLCGTKAEVTVPSLDDWEKQWEKNLQPAMPSKLPSADCFGGITFLAFTELKPLDCALLHETPKSKLHNG